MSIRLMTMVWDIEFPTQSQKLLMLKLADYASDAGGSVFPATETLATRTGCDERTVQRALKAFRQCGLLHLVKAGGTAPGSTNEWQINVQLVTWLAGGSIALVGNAAELEIEGTIPGDTPGKMSAGMGDNTPGKMSARVTKPGLGVTPVSPTPGTTATQSVNNHQIDSSSAGASASNEARSAPAAKNQFTLTPVDPSWANWVEWLSDRDRRDLVVAAQEAGQMIVLGSKWPNENSTFPRIDLRPAIAKRKAGEAA
jgi:hypothetical protein